MPEMPRFRLADTARGQMTQSLEHIDYAQEVKLQLGGNKVRYELGLLCSRHTHTHSKGTYDFLLYCSLEANRSA